MSARNQRRPVKNLYEPHPFMIDSGSFWRCDHGSTGWYACQFCGQFYPEKFAKHYREVGILLTPKDGEVS